MDTKHLMSLLEQVQTGQMSTGAAMHQLKQLPFENLGFARIDNHRCIRTGVSEVIYCEGKTIEQTQGIVKRLARHNTNIMATRATPEMAEGIKQVIDDCIYHEAARIVVIKPRPVKKKGNIAVVTAGTSDIPVAEEAAITAETLGNHVNRIYDAGVAGIHRILNVREDLYQANVAVVVAGMEGALTSVVGGLVSCPVIGVPTSVGYGASFGGISALLCMLNSCASGVSVVNIDNGFGAGFQAGLINKLAVRHLPEEKDEENDLKKSGNIPGMGQGKIALLKAS
ncbi:Pyridinium-3,5-biscarboxylic acid mononucleotide synthase [Desulfonema limicola]|uniref:Pyridinium-3,5-biscarboxylic acid mononucleotide synthase n=1 Tax=Desulfonema limicola TaxID=45656 RepID=A0A975B9D6_9BACT|nr:nickel pincer cofactor biosynthesis protein LarB [Desulfonema limicola]QTA81409.1 Pyridinium-3,5-biscarboxylic acid mononucleotide synthase [Desulfonema limicola]